MFVINCGQYGKFSPFVAALSRFTWTYYFYSNIKNTFIWLVNLNFSHLSYLITSRRASGITSNIARAFSRETRAEIVEKLRARTILFFYVFPLNSVNIGRGLSRNLLGFRSYDHGVHRLHLYVVVRNLPPKNPSCIGSEKGSGKVPI